MPRLVPQTAFTVVANQVANAQMEKNLTLPHPSQTGDKDRKFVQWGDLVPTTFIKYYGK